MKTSKETAKEIANYAMDHIDDFCERIALSREIRKKGKSFVDSIINDLDLDKDHKH